jgi:lipid-binding SYLF domain-containing protein
MINRLSLGLISVALAVGTTTVHAQAREEARLLNAQQVLKDLHSSPDQFVPQALLERAYGIAIIPDVTKAAFFLGGARGNGVLVVRDKDGRFNDPIFVNLTGGSFGFQWGVQSTDVVLVFTTQRSIDKITSGKLTLGADASIAAGPVGRQASAATDPTFHSEVYSYSRSRGLFVGIALTGDALTIDNNADARFYDRGTADALAIANGSIRTNDDIARRFLTAVNIATNTQLPASASAAPASGAPYAASEDTDSGSGAAPQGSSGSAAAGSASTQGATTFPLADPHPGAEPPR